MQKITITAHTKGRAPRIQLRVTDSTCELSPSAYTWLNTAVAHNAVCPGKFVGERWKSGEEEGNSDVLSYWP